MKKIKHFTLSIASTILVTIALSSCSNEDLNNSTKENLSQPENHNNLKSKDNIIYEVFHQKLINKYETFQFSREIEMKDEDDVLFKLIEAEINPETKVYFLFNTDYQKDIALLEYNLNEKITITDYINEDVFEIHKLEELPNFELNGYDIIELADYNQTHGIIIGGGRRFWGWTCGPKYSLEPGSCYQNCEYSVLWSKASGSSFKIVGCGTYPNAKHDMTIGVPEGGNEIY